MSSCLRRSLVRSPSSSDFTIRRGLEVSPSCFAFPFSTNPKRDSFLSFFHVLGPSGLPKEIVFTSVCLRREHQEVIVERDVCLVSLERSSLSVGAGAQNLS